MQRKLLEAGIPVKGESGNPVTWRYKFYAADAKVKKKDVDCIGLPMAQLPEMVQSVIGQLLGTPCGEVSVPNSPESAPNGQEGVNPL